MTNALWMNTVSRTKARVLVIVELKRQLALKESGKFKYTCEDNELTDGERLTILVEEVGEIARAMQNKDSNNLREEITQVAAVAISWLSNITKNQTKEVS